MKHTALKLVTSDDTTPGGPPSAGSSADQRASDTPARRLFEHWVFMLSKNPKRCAFGPKRVSVIERALALYDEETLMLAIEGCAASAWHGGANDRGREFNDIELIFRDEAHIERFVADGEQLRERVEREMRRSPAAPDGGPARPSDEVLRKLRDVAAELSRRARA